MKIAIIGAGNVGASCASLLACKSVCEQIVLIDINANLAKAKALDLSHMAAILDLDIKINGSDDYELLRDFDIVVITAGFARKDGQSREDLAKANASIVSQSAAQIAKFAPNSIIIVVTNPLDLMVYVALNASKFKPNKVIGMAGELDSGRLKFQISSQLNTNVTNCNAICLGMHNDSMICQKSSMKVGEKALSDVLSDEDIQGIIHRSRTSGAKIVELMGTSAFYGPAAGVLKLCQSIKNESNNTLVCSVCDDSLIPTGRVVKLDKNGLKEIVEPNLTNEEEAKLQNSIDNLILFINTIYK
ncbi:malate dehydrogenase, NAD-dependent [Campylobacter iguaniorum]|uniref:malate dehydrogenase n=1 Tax=Campylobacter iguaniorum TaxID=1244531 RepID=UPI00073A4CF5|nr:malate dehydrogenase [Campylobacter iguaniorum]ALV24455.1 malate dehydrogenase, NAD-dependent [Campylobacter iguaniorum]